MASQVDNELKPQRGHNGVPEKMRALQYDKPLFTACSCEARLIDVDIQRLKILPLFTSTCQRLETTMFLFVCKANRSMSEYANAMQVKISACGVCGTVCAYKKSHDS